MVTYTQHHGADLHALVQVALMGVAAISTLDIALADSERLTNPANAHQYQRFDALTPWADVILGFRKTILLLLLGRKGVGDQWRSVHSVGT
jgi:hypothetical protein